MKTLLSILAFVCCTQLGLAQQPEGTIRSTQDAVFSKGVHLPEGIQIYDAPNGQVVATVKDGWVSKGEASLPLLPELVNLDADYQYFERRQGFVRFYSEGDHYWLKESELEQFGYRIEAL